MKKITAWLLVAAMLGGSLTPASNVQAAEAGSIEQQVTGESGTEEGGTQQPGSEEGNTQQPGSEEGDTKQPGTEEAGPEEPSTEEPEIDPTLLVSELSPADSRVIVIDPGHCKTHPGASGNGLREEVVTLDISQACQDALNEYGDVTVYMTRETGSCCKDLKLGDCLVARNNYAKMLSADFLVSMHINAGASTGANVLAAYKSGYHDSIRKETQEFGKLALSKLKKIGIANRGLLLRKSGTGNRYSNGQLADYYSIVRNGVIQNIPSVIIEHGYITSSSDCSKFFNTAAKRKKVGQADADAIISYYGLEEELIKGNFTKNDGEIYYITKDDKKVVGWVKNDGNWYYFDQKGKQVTGFVTIGEDTFYLSPSTGKMVTGSFKVGSVYYMAKGNGTLVKGTSYSDGIYTYLYQTNGKRLKKGLHTVEGDTYYVNSSKHIATGVQKVSGKYYLFENETGKMLTGYQKYNGKYYYLDPETGVMARKKIVEVDGSKYYFGSSGTQSTGLITYKSNKYYFDTKTGKMKTGWKKVNGKYYYFSKTTGKMQKNKWIGKYYVNSKGIRIKKK